MKLALACLLPLAFIGQHALGNPARVGQTPLVLQDDRSDAFLSMVSSPGVSAVESLSNFIMTSLTDSQREELMLKLWEQHDVVDVMTMTGHGDGLEEKRLVQVFGECSPRIMTEGDKYRLKKAGYNFMDITDHPNLGQINHQRGLANVVSLDNPIDDKTKSSIKAMMTGLDDKHLRADIAKLSSFWNRNYKSHWGLSSSDWIHDQVEAIFNLSNRNKIRTSVRKFHHKFVQNSIIARIESVDDNAEDKELIILSAHQDSLNYMLPFYRAPGADDDGSGSVTCLQVLRSLVELAFVPPSNLALEFHWFAAEEGGLLGSQDVAAAYEKEGKKIKGMLHMDMTAFVKKGTTPIVAFFQNQVDANLTVFATKLVDEYLPLKWNFTGCGKSCGSDHMSFYKAGFPVTFATEGLFEDGPLDNIHTANDDTDQDGQYNFDHMLQFVKLGMAFVAELAARQ